VLTWKKALFSDFARLLTQARWSETFWYADMGAINLLIWCKNCRNRLIFAKVVATVYCHVLCPRSVCASLHCRFHHQSILPPITPVQGLGLDLRGQGHRCLCQGAPQGQGVASRTTSLIAESGLRGKKTKRPTVAVRRSKSKITRECKTKNKSQNPSWRCRELSNKFRLFRVPRQL